MFLFSILLIVYFFCFAHICSGLRIMCVLNAKLGERIDCIKQKKQWWKKRRHMSCLGVHVTWFGSASVTWPVRAFVIPSVTWLGSPLAALLVEPPPLGRHHYIGAVIFQARTISQQESPLGLSSGWGDRWLRLLLRRGGLVQIPVDSLVRYRPPC